MKKISAAGRSFQLGSADSLANFDEKPVMPVTLTYDFWMDSTEVTQSQYQNVMGVNPVPDTSRLGKGAAFPVYYVSWFDAALYCNALSKKCGLDTVYSYFVVTRALSGSVNDLAGLRIHFDKDGIRLPTEAEWVYAAIGGNANSCVLSSADSIEAQAVAWYAANANGSTHEVALKRPNGYGLYDLAGNTFEWTSDWKGALNTAPITNPIGAQLADASDEKVIKGGSFEHGIFYLRPSCRSVTYPVSLASTVEYIGFRCVRGAVPSPKYIGQGVNPSVTNPVDVTVSSVQGFLHTTNARLVFVNVTGQVRTLCFVNFAEQIPQVREYTDEINVHLPTLSPDGRYVAYCTRDIGFGDSSSIVIRSTDSLNSPCVRLATAFAYAPKWLVRQPAGDTCIAFTNSAIDNAMAEWAGTETFLQAMSAGKPVVAPQVLIQNGSFHDGVSADGRYAATGYTRLMMRNLGENVQKQLFTYPLNGKDSSGSTQVCNVSLCQDTSFKDRCMFLDFGSSQSSLIGGPYELHQYIFIVNFSGSVLVWFKYPAGETAWDYPKWSPQSNFAVATARNASDQSHAIYGIDLSRSSYIELASGIEIDQPYLWLSGTIPTSSDLDPDSLGKYNDPIGNVYQDQTASKMELFWKTYQDMEAAFIGSSQIYNGIDCGSFTSVKAVNLGYAGGGILGLVSIVNDYVLPHCTKIKVIGFSATPYWLNQANGDISWTTGVGQSKGFVYDMNHNFWKVSVPPGFDAAISNATQYYSSDTACGLIISPCQGWGGSSPDLGGATSWAIDSVVISNLEQVHSLAIELAALHIHMIVINFPESPAYQNTPFYGRDGPDWETGKAIMDTFQSFEQGNPYYHFYDAYQNGNHDYADSEASNWNHLCPVGARKLSRRLDSLIKTFLQ